MMRLSKHDKVVEYIDDSAAILAQLTNIEGGLGHAQMMKILLASAAGVLEGATTTEVRIKSIDEGTDRITATVDADGNRQAIALDVS